MFTGIISSIGAITSSQKRGDLAVAISCPWRDLRIGESVAVNGACLTVTEKTADGFSAAVSDETIARTAPRWSTGERVNLERALNAGDALSGHMVTGHVDGLTKIIAITQAGDSHVLELEAPPALARFIAEKGSVTLDGVSLTVNQVDGNRFFVNIIPHSWDATTFHARKPGDVLNLEIDIIARYVARLMQK
jgi:riboflavin synthase